MGGWGEWRISLSSVEGSASAAVEGLGRGPNWPARRPAAPRGSTGTQRPRRHPRAAPQAHAGKKSHRRALSRPPMSTAARLLPPPEWPTHYTGPVAGAQGRGHLTRQGPAGGRGMFPSPSQRHQGPPRINPAGRPLEAPSTPPGVAAHARVPARSRPLGDAPIKIAKPTKVSNTRPGRAGYLDRGARSPPFARRPYLCWRGAWNHISRKAPSRRFRPRPKQSQVARSPSPGRVVAIAWASP